jgi:hypothetical protein
MDRQAVIDMDDRKIGVAVAEQGGCVIVESGRVHKVRHAIPETFLHRTEGEIRSTVGQDIVSTSPKVDLDHWDEAPVRLYYGLDAQFETDPDPDTGDEIESVARGVEPAPAQRARLLEGEDEPGASRPAVHERQASAADPAGVTANLTDRKPEAPE